MIGFYFPASREREERKNMGGNDTCITFFNSTLSKNRSYSFPALFSPASCFLRVGRNKQLLDHKQKVE